MSKDQNRIIHHTQQEHQTWRRPIVTPAIGISYAPADDTRLYAWSVNSLLRSSDGGSSWAAMAWPTAHCGLSIAPDNANRLYARACVADSGPRLYRSDDGGQTWLAPTTTLTPTLTGLAAMSNGVLLGTDGARAYRSANAGQSWKAAPIGAALSNATLAAAPDGVLYLGSPSGLLRSQEGGQSWENSDIARPISPTLALQGGRLLGRDNSGPIQISSTGSSWAIEPATLPGGTRLVALSVHDPSRLYALTNSSLWRRTTITMSYRSYMPMVSYSSAASDATPNEQAIAYLNQLRSIAGVAPLQSHPALVQAAQNHANYYLLNYGDSSAWSYGRHGEVAGKPGFTGRWPWDRAEAAQYPWVSGGEVIAYIHHPSWAVDSWLSGIYHRMSALNPLIRYAGYGISAHSDLPINVMDFGVGAVNQGTWSPALPFTIIYPAAGQTGIPIWGVNEQPSVTTANITIIGFPVSLQIGRGTTLVITAAELRNSSGQVVGVLPTPHDSAASGFYALIPDRPLEPSTIYTANVAGAVDGVPFDRTWSFTTASSE